MVTRTIDYWWAVCILNNDYNSREAEVFDTLEDLLATRMNHDDMSVNTITCWAYHYLISPDRKEPMIIDEVHMEGREYILYKYNGTIMLPGDCMFRGAIDDIKNRCPLLFKQGG